MHLRFLSSDARGAGWLVAALLVSSGAAAQGLDATPAPSPAATPSAAPELPDRLRPPTSYDTGTPGQWGYPGALRVVAASPGATSLSVTTGVEWFSEKGFIVEGKNHRRTVNTIAVEQGLGRFLAVSVVVVNMANHSAATNPLYIAALGDVDVGARGVVVLSESESLRLSAGVRGGVRLMQGDEPGRGVESSASPYGRGLLTAEIPFARFSLDAGYLNDNSSALVPEDTTPDPSQLYAYGVSEYDAIVGGIALDFPRFRAAPFFELTTRMDLGDAEGEPATLATAGVKLASASRRISLFAAYDSALSGTEVEIGRLRAPTWQVAGGLSYVFGDAAPRKPRGRTVRHASNVDPAGEPAATRLRGKVMQMATRQPIAGATISIEGGPTVTTDPKGAFDAVGLKSGTARISVRAPGFQERRSTVFLAEGKSYSVDLLLFAAPVAAPTPTPAPVLVLSPALVQGKIVSTKGKPLAATITVVFAGKTQDVKTDAKGVYRLDLVEGPYTLKITAPGMRPQTHQGTLKPNEAFELDFMLSPEKKKKP